MSEALETLRAVPERSGFSAQHLRALALLCQRPMTLRELSHFMGLSYSQASRNVTDLDRRGLIERVPGDQQARDIKPTPLGRAFDKLMRKMAINEEEITWE
jgi:DNA-binding MarR family transcriptional regulator